MTPQRKPRLVEKLAVLALPLALVLAGLTSASGLGAGTAWAAPDGGLPGEQHAKTLTDPQPVPVPRPPDGPAPRPSDGPAPRPPDGPVPLPSDEPAPGGGEELNEQNAGHFSLSINLPEQTVDIHGLKVVYQCRNYDSGDYFREEIVVANYSGPSVSPLLRAGSECVFSLIEGAGAEFEITSEATVVIGAGEITPIELELALIPRVEVLEISSQINKGEGIPMRQLSYSYKCRRGEEPKVVDRGITSITPNGKPMVVSRRLPKGSTCTVELMEHQPEYGGYVEIAHRGSTSVTIEADKANTAKFRHAWAPMNKGAISIRVQEIYNPGLDTKLTRRFDVRCGDETKTIEGNVGDRPIFAGWYPDGQTCTVAQHPEDVVQIPYQNLEMAPAKTVEVKSHEYSGVWFRNDYSPKPAELMISLDLEGLPESDTDRRFQVDYSCLHKTGSVSVAPGGEPAVLDMSETEYEHCSVSLNEQLSQIEGYYLDHSGFEIDVFDGRANVARLKAHYKAGIGALRVRLDSDISDLVANVPLELRCAATNSPSKYSEERNALLHISEWAENKTVLFKDLPAGSRCEVTAGWSDDGTHLYKLAAPVVVTVPNGTVGDVDLNGTWVPKDWDARRLDLNVEFRGIDPYLVQNQMNYKCRYRDLPLVADGFEATWDGGWLSGPIPIGSECDIYFPFSIGESTAGYEPLSTEPVHVTVVPGDSDAQRVDVVREYRRKLSTFLLGVYGQGDAPFDFEVPVEYKCGEDSGTLMVQNEGFAIIPREYPVGTSCEFSAVVEGLNRDGYTVVAPESVTSTVSELGRVEYVHLPLSFSYNPEVDPSRQDGFSVQYTFREYYNVPESLKTHDFRVNWRCGTESGQIALSTPNVPVSAGRTFPFGTKCLLEMDPESINIKGLESTVSSIDPFWIGQGDEIVKKYYIGFTHESTSAFITNTVENNVDALSMSASIDVELRCNPHFGDPYSRELSIRPGTTSEEINLFPGLCSIRVAALDEPGVARTESIIVNGKPLNSVGRVFELTANDITRIEVVNQYDAQTSRLAIASTGVGADTRNKEFLYHWSCGSRHGSAVVKGDGVPVQVNDPVLVGTSCLVWQDPEFSSIEGWDLITTPIQFRTVSVGEPVVFSFENSYNRRMRVLRVAGEARNVFGPSSDPGAELVYKCTASFDAPVEGFVSLKANEDSIVPLPEGVCTLKLREKHLPGYNFSWGFVGEEEGVSKEIVVGEWAGNTYDYWVWYSYSPELGSFAVAVTGVGAEAVSDSNVSYRYDCGRYSGYGDVVGDGTLGKLHEVPIGSTCQVRLLDDSAYLPFYDVSLPASQTIAIESTERVVVPFEVVYTPRPTSFSVKQTVENGPFGAELVHHNFHYSCSNEEGVIAEGDLSVVANGRAVTANESLPAGTSCVISETSKVEVPSGYTLGATEPQTVEIVAGRNAEAVFVDRYTRTDGSLIVTNHVRVDAAYLAYGSELTYTYTCNEGQESAQNGTFTLRPDEPKEISGLPAGTCIVADISTPPQFADVTTTAQLNGEDVKGPAYSIPVTVGEVTRLDISSMYAAHYGNLVIAKTVQGVDPGDRTFEAHWVCFFDGNRTRVGDMSGVVQVDGRGTPVSVDSRIRAGSECYVSSRSSGIPGYSIVGFSGVKVTIAKDIQALAHLKDEYALDRGSLAVNLSVSKNDEVAGDFTFDFSYSCTAQDETVKTGQFQITGEGSRVVEGLPVGECTITQQNPRIEGFEIETTLSDGSTRFPGPSINVHIFKDSPTYLSSVNEVGEEFVPLVVKNQVQGIEPDGSLFQFHWSCGFGNSGYFNLPANVAEYRIPFRFPVGSTCTVIQVGRPRYDGFKVTSPADVTVTLEGGGSPAIASFVNDYVPRLGSFELSAVASGTDADMLGGKPFTFAYTCQGGSGVRKEGTVSVDDTTPARVDGLPVGTCTIQETSEAIANADIHSTFAVHGSPVYSPEWTFGIEEDAVVPLSVNKSVTAHVGSFSVAKAVNGVEVADREFEFTYDCGGATGSLRAQANGVAVPAGHVFRAATSCTVREDTAGAVIDGYNLSAPPPQTFTIVKDQTTEVRFTNEYTLRSGSFSVAKTVTDGPEAAIQKNYTFNYNCGGEEGTVVAKGDGVAVPANKQFRMGTSCVVTEDQQTAQIPGYQLTPPEAQTVVIQEDTTAALAFANAYVRKLGSFTVTKTAKGAPAAHAEKEYSFNYDCQGDTGTLTATANDDAVPAGKNWPVGTSCTITENTEAAAIEGYNLSATGPQTVVITDAVTVNVSFTNSYAQKVGTFKVAKTLEGAPAAASSKDYTFNYDCAGTTGRVTAKGGGAAVAAGKDFPVGTSCTITEDAAVAAIEGYTLTQPQAQTVQIVEAAPVVATFHNAYVRKTGSFTVAVTTSGSPATASTKNYPFNYDCAGDTGQVTAKGDGVAVPIGKTFPTGTSCKITPDAQAAQIAGYSLHADQQRTIEITEGDPQPVTFAHAYQRELGSLSLTKQVTGTGAEKAAGKEFTIHYLCHGLDGTEPSGKVNVRAGETQTVPAIPVGRCAIREAAAPIADTDLTVSAMVDDVAAGQQPFTAQIVANKVTNVAVTNEYTLHVGSFTVAKKVVGAEVGARDFIFNYDCAGEPGAVKVKGDGVAVAAGKSWPVGTQCTITEDASGAAIEGYNLEAAAPQKVVIAKDVNAPLVFTNTYERKMGTFKVAKTVSGGPEGAAAKDFIFNYDCAGEPGTVKVKGDGVAVAAGKDLPTGTQCTITEDTASAQLAGYTLAVPEAQTIKIAEGEPVVAAFRNEYSRDLGSFSVAKIVDGDGADLAAGKEFDFSYSCTGLDGTVTKGSFKLGADGVKAVADVAVGRCTLTEADAGVAGADVAGTFTVAGSKTQGASVKFDVAKDAKSNVTATNTYTAHVGSFSVAKTVNGVDAAGKNYKFNWVCGSEKGTMTVTPGAPAVAVGRDFRVGTSCTVREENAGAVIDGYNLQAPPPQTFAIVKDQTTEVRFTNAYTLKVGSFKVAKTVNGGPEAATAKEYTFNFDCAGATGQVKVKGDGEAVAAGKNWPVGTSCTITEQTNTAQIAGYTLSALPAQVIKIEEGAAALAKFVNTYTLDTGSIVVDARVTGGGADLAGDAQIDVSYSCVNAQNKKTEGVFKLAAGRSKRINDVPAGTCTIKGMAPTVENTDLATTVLIAGSAGGSGQFELAKGQEQQVSIEANYTAHTGSFAVSLKVSGAPDQAADKDYKFNWSCGGQSGEIAAKGDGVAVPVGKAFRAGTSCTITPDLADTAIPGYTFTPGANVVLLVGKDTTGRADFAHKYVKKTEPAPEPSESATAEPGASASASASASVPAGPGASASASAGVPTPGASASASAGVPTPGASASASASSSASASASAGVPTPPAEVSVVRLSGYSRYETSAKVMAEGQWANAVVLASGTNAVDALAATPLAGALDAPVLLSAKNALEEDTRRMLLEAKAAGASQVVITGGTSSISAAVEGQIRSLGFEVVRIAGNDRFATASKIGEETARVLAANGSAVGAVLFVDGQSFPDGLTAGPAAVAKNGIILLTDGKRLPADAAAQARKLNVDVYAIGGNAVSATRSLNAAAVMGRDRYETAVMVANTFLPETRYAVITSGQDFPDALSGGALAADKGGALLLTRPNAAPPVLISHLRAVKYTSLHVVGGQRSVSEGVLSQLRTAQVR